MARATSGQAPFTFSLCEDLYSLPEKARRCEVDLHGGFAVDREGDGHIFYGMPGCGLMPTSPDLATQEIIELPSDLKPVNFHSTRIVDFDGKRRLVLPANDDAMVAVVGLDGGLDFVIPRPEFQEYENEDAYRPTDVAWADDTLYIADGYGANYVSTVDLTTKRWTGIFGGKTDDPHAQGRFGTAHGMRPTPDGEHLAIADRPHARIEHVQLSGHHHSSHALPGGSKPCGIDYRLEEDRWFALVGSLRDPVEGRPAPIYVLDAESHDVVSTIRPKEELGIELAQHIHNAIWYEHSGQVYLICQAWNPGHYFVLVRES